MLIYGINPVIEALRAGRVKGIRVSDRAGARVADVMREAQRTNVPIQRVPSAEIDRASRGGVHQGIVAELREEARTTIDDIVSSAAGAPLILVVDGVEDPRNLGAILRTVDAAGGHGVIRQLRHAAPLDGAAAKASAGAVAHVKVADVVNIARAIEELKEANVWTVGLAADGKTRYDEVDLTLPTAVVVGAEGGGLRRLVRERCDRLVSIPMHGHVHSLNVSVAAAVVLFEAARQRRRSQPGVGT